MAARGRRGTKRTNVMTRAVKEAIVKQAKIEENNTNSINTQSNLTYDNSKKLSNEIEGEKYLIVHRIDDGLTMKNMSPILLETAFKTVTNNGNITCRTLKSGDIMIKTENVKQAKNLIKLTKIAHANIDVTEHKTLNSCKGVVSAFELTYEEEETLLEYLKPQNVTKIDFHKKTVGKEKIKSGLVFLTFGKNEPPEYIQVGCIRLKVRAYIPAPMRCYTCHKFGHISKVCPNLNAPKCYNCYEDKHIQSRDEKCTKQQKCINCGSNEHNSYNRSCIEFKRQTNIQTIKVTQKVSFSEAVKLSNLQRNSYAQITANNVSTTPTNNKQCQCPHCGYHTKRNENTRKAKSYEDLNQNVEETEQIINKTQAVDESVESEVEEDSSDQND
jgi:hypothetical protein